MPCNDGGVPYPPTREEILDSKAPAMLCAVLSALRANLIAVPEVVIDLVDEKAAGVTRAEIHEWWKVHRHRDAARKQREAADSKRKATKKRALAKLTTAERRALGLGDE